MPIYNAPLKDMEFILNDVFQAEQFWQGNENLAHLDMATANAILEEMAKFSKNVILDLNRPADEEGGAQFKNGEVTTPKGCTIAGLNEMEHQGFSSALIKGIKTSFDKI